MSTDAGTRRPGVGRSSGMLLIARLTASAGFFVSVLIVARSLGSGGRGSLAFLTVATLVVAEVASLGLATSSAVLVARGRHPGTVLLNLLLFTFVATALCAVFAFGTLILLDVEPAGVSNSLLALCIVSATLAGLIDGCLTFLVATGRVRSYALLVATAPWLYSALLLVTELTFGLTVAHAFVAFLISSGAATLAAIVASSRAGVAAPDLAIFREGFSFGFRAWAGRLATFLNFRVDQVLMAFLVADTVLGVYAVAVNVSEVLFYIPAIVGVLIVPLVANLDEGARDEAVAHLLRVSFLIITVASLVAAATAPFLIPVVFGEDFEASVKPFLLLLPGAFGFTALQIVSGALVGVSRPARSSVGPIVALVTGVVLDLILIPRAGASGAAVAASVALIAGGTAAVISYRMVSTVKPRELIPRRADVAALRGLFDRSLAAVRR